MISIENVDTFGWVSAIRGMRNPLNSWGKSDSQWTYEFGGRQYYVGNNDRDLMTRLVKAGSDHGKFMRMINVTMDVTAPLYWWKEFDTYKVGTVANSCSTMHKIHAKEFTMDDFSHEHLIECVGGSEDWTSPLNNMDNLIYCLNRCREEYLETKDKTYWWQMIQLLPSSYNQKRTVQLNYQVLRNMYHSRKNHKLDEWRVFCNAIEMLPYSDLITMEK